MSNRKRYAREPQKKTQTSEILNVNIVINLIFLILHYIPTVNRNITQIIIQEETEADRKRTPGNQKKIYMTLRPCHISSRKIVRVKQLFLK